MEFRQVFDDHSDKVLHILRLATLHQKRQFALICDYAGIEFELRQLGDREVDDVRDILGKFSGLALSCLLWVNVKSEVITYGGFKLLWSV